MFFLLLASLVLGAGIENSCSELFKEPLRITTETIGVRLDAEGVPELAFNCFNSLVSLTDNEAKTTLEGVKNFTELYAFVDDLKNPPEGMVSYDILGRLNSVETDNVEPFKFYTELQDIFQRTRDAHTSFTPPCYTSAFQIYMPMKLCPAIEDGQMVVRTCATQPDPVDDIVIPPNTKVMTINNKDAFEFLQEFAEHHALTGRDMSQQFELYLGRQTRMRIRDLLKLTENKDAVVYNEFAYTSLDVEFDGTGRVTVPFILVTSSDPYERNRCSSNYANDNHIKLSRSLLLRDNRLETMGYGQPDPVRPRVSISDDVKLEVNPIEERAQRKFLEQSEFHLSKAIREENDPSGSFVFTDGDDQCVIHLDTFYPADLGVWLDEMTEAITMAKNAKCGIVTGTEDGKVQGKRLLLDVRDNGGGYTILLDIFTAVLFPSRTPPHFSVDIKRLPALQKELAEKLSALEGPAAALPSRQPYNFKPVPICGGEYTIGCDGWSDQPISRHEQAYSQPMHHGSLPWEMPKIKSTWKLLMWLTQSNVQERYGFEASAMVFIQMARNLIGDYEPDPELTVLLTGYTSASCTAQLATRMVGYNLGAVVRQGYQGHNPMMAALVPGGNVFQHSILVEEGILSQLPHKADVAITTMATVAYTHDMSSDATLPMEFVTLPPHYVFQYWEDTGKMTTSANMEKMQKALNAQIPIGRCVKNLHSRFFTEGCDRSDFPNAKYVGRLCNEDTGRYDGECGAVLCEFGYELSNGRCVDNGFTTPNVLKYRTPVWLTAIIVIICIIVVIIIAVIACCICKCIRGNRSTFCCC